MYSDPCELYHLYEIPPAYLYICAGLCLFFAAAILKDFISQTVLDYDSDELKVVKSLGLGPLKLSCEKIYERSGLPKPDYYIINIYDEPNLKQDRLETRFPFSFFGREGISCIHRTEPGMFRVQKIIDEFWSENPPPAVKELQNFARPTEDDKVLITESIDHIRKEKTLEIMVNGRKKCVFTISPAGPSPFYRLVIAGPETNRWLSGRYASDLDPDWKQPYQLIIMSNGGSLPIPCSGPIEQRQVKKRLENFVADSESGKLAEQFVPQSFTIQADEPARSLARPKKTRWRYREEFERVVLWRTCGVKLLGLICFSGVGIFAVLFGLMLIAASFERGIPFVPALFVSKSGLLILMGIVCLLIAPLGIISYLFREVIHIEKGRLFFGFKMFGLGRMMDVRHNLDEIESIGITHEEPEQSKENTREDSNFWSMFSPEELWLVEFRNSEHEIFFDIHHVSKEEAEWLADMFLKWRKRLA